jgi:hypothetical protein
MVVVNYNSTEITRQQNVAGFVADLNIRLEDVEVKGRGEQAP